MPQRISTPENCKKFIFGAPWVMFGAVSPASCPDLVFQTPCSLLSFTKPPHTVLLKLHVRTHYLVGWHWFQVTE